VKRSIFLALASLIILTGCNPQPLVVWAPDGKHCAVLSSDGVRVSDESGAVSPAVAPNVTLCRWLPDSTEAVIVSEKDSTNWKEVREILTPTERVKAAQIGEALWRRPQSKPKDLALVSEACLYIIDKYGKNAAKARFGPKLWTDINNTAHATVRTVQLIALSGGRAADATTLLRTTSAIDDVRVSPNGSMAAVAVSDGLFDRLMVVPLNTGDTRTIVESLSDKPDWSVDGKWLYYIQNPNFPEGLTKKSMVDRKRPWMATLNRRQVADANGKLLAKLAAPEELVELPAEGSSRVRCLPDGSVLFQSKQSQFPCIKDAESTPAIFKLNPGQKSIEVVIPSDKIPNDQLNCFEPNQDGTKIAVPGAHGELAVVDLVSHQVTTLEKTSEQDLRIIPQWRNADELSYGARNWNKPANGHDVDIVLLSISDPNRRIVLSKDWNVKLFGFLKDPEKSKEPLKNASAR
jgi:hypothetical protein